MDSPHAFCTETFSNSCTLSCALCFNTHYAGDDKMKEMERAANESAAAWQRRLEEELQRIITISQLAAVELERAERVRETATKME